MGSEQRIAHSERRRGFGRAAVFLAVALAVFATGCGRSGKGAETDSEKAADVEVLNTLQSQELATIASYERGMSLLRGEALAVARGFRAQELAHVDALNKAIRGVGGEADAEAGELESLRPRSRRDALLLAYEAENAALAQALDAAPRLETAAPRTLAASLAASHAQHLAVLRQALGAPLAAAAPEPLEGGDLPPPAESSEQG